MMCNSGSDMAQNRDSMLEKSISERFFIAQAGFGAWDEEPSGIITLENNIDTIKEPLDRGWNIDYVRCQIVRL